ncbi:DUF1007 family protein [Breznakiella homolactica]|uniref:DUF1007 family protein n=1 Tax=Breznakiella homolactica TaxID=2798577 RepID=A0A7T8BA63_9SPIR|nr:DUF1007 family protein [Breznakiella homolactica]QQO10339.1 DUF1007 family protein [Breznakiella homolactica]
MIIRHRKKIIAAVLFLLAPVFVFAHPHMFLESKVEFEYSGEECTGFWLEWTFDPYFSASIIQECDKDRNKRFSAEEAEYVYSYGFINLRKYGYFIYLRSGDNRVNPEGVEQFTPSIRNDRLVYRFFVNLKGKGYGKDFSVAIFDSTYFCAVRYPESGVVTVRQNGPGAAPRWERGENKKYPVYYNPFGASNDMTIYTAWRPGLETAYPDEIRVFF